jgi:hypothetical protein
MASLQTPPVVGAKSGEALTISGMTLPGWSVDVDGKKLSSDGQQRFSGRVQMPSDHRAVAVRLTHPKRGTHIYLRRSSSAKAE